VNAYEPIVVTDLGIVMDVKDVHVSNALSLISPRLELGSNITVLKAVSLVNADPPIVVTDLGIVMDVKDVQSWNAPPSISPRLELGSNITVLKAISP